MKNFDTLSPKWKFRVGKHLSDGTCVYSPFFYFGNVGLTKEEQQAELLAVLGSYPPHNRHKDGDYFLDLFNTEDWVIEEIVPLSGYSFEILCGHEWQLESLCYPQHREVVIEPRGYFHSGFQSLLSPFSEF